MQEFRKRVAGKKHIIWDWNGTILNDATLTHAVLCDVLTAQGYPPISFDEYRAKFCFPVRHFYTEVLGLNICHEAFERMSKQFIQTYGERVHECHVFDGLIETMHGLHQEDVHHSVLSAAYEPHLHEQLDTYGIKHLLRHAYGINNIHAAGKVDRARQLVDTLGQPRDELILIGDTAHDYEVANAIGIDCLLVADGHYSAERLHAVHDNVLESRFC